MKTILIILGILAVGAAVYFYFYKTGKINDRDGDYIPDEIEDADWFDASVMPPTPPTASISGQLISHFIESL